MKEDKRQQNMQVQAGKRQQNLTLCACKSGCLFLPSCLSLLGPVVSEQSFQNKLLTINGDKANRSKEDKADATKMENKEDTNVKFLMFFREDETLVLTK